MVVLASADLLPGCLGTSLGLAWAAYSLAHHLQPAPTFTTVAGAPATITSVTSPTLVTEI